ncbi:hypothetical protein DPMN_029410 [Dreissena polymorpha]|uniref:Uncharacterized protein n=1 Tax=Dreissena polymorpha TaxID=45954 RepID=A0A9D4LX57_DREPO|nr:hypothetical protein DPMN_029410 [Dreissena polymorpha]
MQLVCHILPVEVLLEYLQVAYWLPFCGLCRGDDWQNLSCLLEEEVEEEVRSLKAVKSSGVDFPSELIICASANSVGGDSGQDERTDGQTAEITT